MDRLFNLVRHCQKSKDLDWRLRLVEDIVTEVGPQLQAYIFRACPDAAEDISQETLNAVATGVRQFRGNSGQQFWGWCYRIASNKINSHLRKKMSVRTESFSEDELWQVIDDSSHNSALAFGERLDLEYAMNLVKGAKPPCFDYLWNFYILGWDYKAIGEEYGLRPETARMRISRCLELAQSLVSTLH